jgi:hypothetical protein
MITLHEVRRRVEEIERTAGQPHCDDENAHSLEDELHVAVLRAVAEGMAAEDAAELAREALTTCDLDFCRWYE